MSLSLKKEPQLSTQLKKLKMNDENQVISSCLRKLLNYTDLEKNARRSAHWLHKYKVTKSE